MNDARRKRAHEQLLRAGLRTTAPRLTVLSILMESEEHMSADEVLKLAQAELPELNRATVYRTLERLRDHRVLSETDLGDGLRRYELVTAVPHHHLICSQCGAITELDDALLQPLRRGIEAAHGFESAIYHLALYGRCQSCRTGLPSSETPRRDANSTDQAAPPGTARQT
jgi:Fur family ferric uptake transcriptional regulator